MRLFSGRSTNHELLNMVMVQTLMVEELLELFSKLITQNQHLQTSADIRTLHFQR